MADTKQQGLQDTIVVSPNGMFTANPMPLEQMLNIFCAALTAGVGQLREMWAQQEDLDDEKIKALDKVLFDQFNQGFSKCMELAFPDQELHPELTEEAMKRVLAKEDEILAAKAKHRKKPVDNIIPQK